MPTLIPSNFLPTRTRLQTLGGERRQSIHGYTGQPAAALALTLRTAHCTFCFKSPKQSTNKLPNWPPTSNVCCTCNNQDTPVMDSGSGILYTIASRDVFILTIPRSGFGRLQTVDVHVRQPLHSYTLHYPGHPVLSKHTVLDTEIR